MKNIEWGAVAYLTQSKYGICINGICKEMTHNSNGNFYTGISIEDNTSYSTTKNIYGIYDMSGGAWEYVMGVMKDEELLNLMSGTSTSYNSGYIGKVYDSGDYNFLIGREWPNDKYYDLYEFGVSKNDSTAYLRNKTGDATTETRNWNDDYDYIVNNGGPWFRRGGHYMDANKSGIFCSDNDDGAAYSNTTFRPVLVEK